MLEPRQLDITQRNHGIFPVQNGLTLQIRLSIFVLMLLTVCGCARWSETPEPTQTGFRFPETRMARDAVALEIGLAQLDISQTETFEQFWVNLDQQKIELPVRKILDQNGIRVAVMPSHAPAILNRLLKPRPLELEKLSIVEEHLAKKDRLDKKPRIISHQRISNREGESHEIETSEVHAAIAWNVRNGEQQTIGSGKLVRGVFAIITLPQGDGTVRLKFTPQIHHGEVRPTFGVADRAFVRDSSQTVNSLKDLELDITVRPGETIVLAPTPDIGDLGQLFFGSADNPDLIVNENFTHRVLLVRVVQTQMNDLFGNDELREKLSTTRQH